MPAGFNVTTQTAGGACVGEAHVITASGVPTGELGQELERALRAVYEDGGDKVAIDLSALDGIESDSLDMVLRYVARFRARGGDVVLAGPGESGLDAVASLLSSAGRP
jgi:anti-anti-sigma regulatory factor